MTIDRNDPRWTAYVLDELSAPERVQFESEMASDPNAAAILAEVRESVLMLGEAFSLGTPPELGPELTHEQRQEVLAAAPQAALRHRSRFGRWSVAAGLAASVLIGVVTVRVVRDIPDRAGSDALMSEAPTSAGAVSANDSLSGPPPEAVIGAAGGSERTVAAPGEMGPSPAAGIPFAVADAPSGAENQVSGQVTDPTGALIPGVEVTATSRETGRAVSDITNARGEFQIDGFESDSVQLRVELPGFRTEVRDVASGDERRQDVVLEVAGTATEVEVAGRVGGTLRSSSATVGLVPRQEGAQAVAQGGGTGFAIDTVAGLVSPPVAAPPAPLPGTPPPAAAFPDQTRARPNTEEYDRITDNPFRAVSEEPLSTFSVDVDRASWANVRRFLDQRTLPPPDAVRIEEMVNYFTYDYAPPRDGRPVRVHAEVAAAPWAPEHRLVRIGIQGQEIGRDERAASNLVFLIDVSGSMDQPNKLPLLVDAMKLLVEQLGENDRVAIVVYAGASGLVLDSTPGFRARQILSALDRLRAGGSTNGGDGIRLAYDVAVGNFIEGGINRVILATDGDFNVGVTNNGDLTRLIEETARTGVFLSVLGFGTGNYNDAGLEALAGRGNGNYAYIDSIREARKVLVEEIGSTLVTIAKDVKIQVEFNPAEVNAYRLIGYENRTLRNQDFNDDAVDAGEIGAGHTITALFEVVPAGIEIDIPGVDPLRYQTAMRPTEDAAGGELLNVKVRYKEPDGDESRLIEAPVIDRGQGFDAASTDHRFAAAVAGFGMILRDSPYRGSASFDSVLRIAEASRGQDADGYREEFVDLVRRARAIRDLNGQ